MRLCLIAWYLALGSLQQVAGDQKSENLMNKVSRVRTLAWWACKRKHSIFWELANPRVSKSTDVQVRNTRGRHYDAAGEGTAGAFASHIRVPGWVPFAPFQIQHSADLFLEAAAVFGLLLHGDQGGVLAPGFGLAQHWLLQALGGVKHHLEDIRSFCLHLILFSLVHTLALPFKQMKINEWISIFKVKNIGRCVNRVG